MNNKGFAVTTLIYGLSIMGIMIVMVILGTVSVSRRNIRDISKQVEQDLLNYGNTNVVYRAIDGRNDEYDYSIPKGEEGFYRIEAWGGASSDGGKGAYTTGIIFLDHDDKLKIKPGSYNNSSIVKTSTNEILMKAAEGTRNIDGGTLCPFTNAEILSNGELNDDLSYNPEKNINGSKFTLIKYNESRDKFSCIFSNYNSTDGVAVANNDSYINGYFFNRNEYYFVDAFMLPGVNDSLGKISIKRVSTTTDKREIKNHMSVKYKNKNVIKFTFKDYDGALDRYAPAYLQYSYFTGDDFYQKYEELHSDNFNSNGEEKYIEISLSGVVDINNVSFILPDKSEFTKPLRGANVKIELINRNDGVDKSETIYDGQYLFISPTGINLSAYQSDSFTDFPSNGNYYILPVNSENNVVNGSNESGSSNPVNFDYLFGNNNQKWSIDKFGENYRIVNLSTFKALDIKYGENYLKRELSTKATFNIKNPLAEQQWHIIGNGDNTFSLKTALPALNEDVGGYIVADTSNGTDTGNLVIGPGNEAPSLVERFRFYSIDFVR